ncbi:hypothetical protein [Mesorhizobium sp.]|uniref:hypothetical protein n=1 Tax=Mesorhizobium sp. TaxID=1871066 RepID=UPI0025CF83E3|nr:hypothetical protein [Mesorhizobium sp.]
MSKIDWTNIVDVIGYARRLGPGQTVFKVPGRANYNITHTERRDRWDRPGYRVICHT